MTSFSNATGRTSIGVPVRTIRRSATELKAMGFELQGNRWVRDAVNTETHAITEIYRGATIQLIEWTATGALG